MAQVLAGAMRVRSLVAAAVAKADEQRINLFLSAASHGDTDTILQVLPMSLKVDTARRGYCYPESATRAVWRIVKDARHPHERS